MNGGWLTGGRIGRLATFGGRFGGARFGGRFGGRLGGKFGGRTFGGIGGRPAIGGGNLRFGMALGGRFGGTMPGIARFGGTNERPAIGGRAPGLGGWLTMRFFWNAAVVASIKLCAWSAGGESLGFVNELVSGLFW